MTKPDDKLGMQEEVQEADPIPDAFPGQDPKVDQEWEKAKEDPMGGESPLQLDPNPANQRLVDQVAG